MRLLLTSLLLTAANAAFAASIPLMDLPLKNGPTAGQVYKMSEHPNSVFVFESFRLSCAYCNQNAANVDQLATEYASNARVQVLDLGLDTADSDFREWVRIHSPNHPVVQDVGYKIFRALKVANSIPQVFVVNCKGDLVGSPVVGTWDGGGNTAVRKNITTALETTCP